MKQVPLTALFLDDFYLPFKKFYRKWSTVSTSSVSQFLFSLSFVFVLHVSFCPVSAGREKGVMLAQVLDCQNTHLHCIYM